MVSTPKPPDPYVQADAQSGANRDASVSAAIINNIDESSPFGSVNYTKNGTETYIDSQGKKVTVPTYRRDVTLSKEQQALYDTQTQASQNLGELAVSQSSRLNGILSEPFNPKNLPARASTSGIKTNTGSIGYDRTFGYNGPETQTQTGANIGQAGPIQRNVGPSDFSEDRLRVEDAVMSRFDRLHERDRESMEAKLANQGLTPGSTAWNEQMDELNRTRTDASMQAILTGGQEQSRLQGMQIDQGNFRNSAQNQQFSQNQARGMFDIANFQAENAAQQQNFAQYAVEQDYDRQSTLMENQRRLQDAQFANQAQSQKYNQQTALRDNALNEAFALRNQPINEITALMSGSQVTVPQFSAPFQQGVAAAPIGQYMQDQYNAELQASQAKMSGLFGLGSSLIGGMFGLSDERTKRDISRVGSLKNGLGVYLYRYIGGPWSVGVMAQEAIKSVPHAVGRFGGLLAVNYGEVAK